METVIVPTDSADAERESAAAAVAALHRGDVVALPTETVYGLAGDILNEAAMARIFEVKDRPSFDPLIVHLPSHECLTSVARIPEALETVHRKLMDRFWPGPLTFILEKQAQVSDLVSAGLPTVAVRMSSHAVFRRIIRTFDGPLAAPSANRFGRISPTSATAVREELGGRIPLIVDGGACPQGIESTIINIGEPDRGPKPRIRILRHGPVTVEDLKPFGKVILPAEQPVETEAPGQMESHYAPGTPLRLLANPGEFEPRPGKRYGLLSYRGSERDGYLGLTDYAHVAVLSPGSGKLPEAAVRFFFLLRHLDGTGVDEIIAEPLPDRGLGMAMMERLRRAAAKPRDERAG